MDAIKKCSISGISFTLETEAYRRLNDYLDSLNKAYKDNPDGAEIVADIEARIAELILSAQVREEQPVQLPLVENIIAQLGNAEDISGEEGADEPIRSQTRIARRLYRDTEGSKLGGVCAGFAKYFDIDPVWIRLGMFLPLLLAWICYHTIFSAIFGNLFLMFIAAYIVAWFAIPAAQTARQKLEMNGEPVTARAIGNATGAATPEQAAKSSVASAVATFGKVVGFLLKAFVVVLALPLIFLCIVMVTAILCFVFGTGGMMANMLSFGNLAVISDIASSLGTAFPVLALLVCLVPVVVLLYMFIALILGKRPRWWVMLAALVLWIFLIVGAIFTAATSADTLSDKEGQRIMKSVDTAEGEAMDDEQIDSLEYSRLLNATNVPSIDR